MRNTQNVTGEGKIVHSLN